MEQISNPHDKFFKEVFTRKDTAEDFLQNYLPGEIAGRFDWDSLELAKDTFVDPHLKAYFSDLLFKAYLKDGSPGYVYILFEHKSYPERLMAFHLLRYMVKIWELFLENKEELGFPVVIPLVVYHGERPWRYGVNFRDLFDDPAEMASFIPDFQYVLWDASRYRDEEIRGNVILRVALLLLKYIFRQDFRDHLPEILNLLRDLSERQRGLEYIEVILRYIVNAGPEENISYEAIRSAVEEALSYKGGEELRTVADSLIEQGMQQGMLQYAREALLESLEVRFEVVPQSIVRRIDEIEELSLLKILHKKSVVVESLEQFKEFLAKIME